MGSEKLHFPWRHGFKHWPTCRQMLEHHNGLDNQISCAAWHRKGLGRVDLKAFHRRARPGSPLALRLYF